MKKQNQATIHLVEDLQKAKRERDGQIDDLLCKIEGIGMALNATAQGLIYEQAREVLAVGLMDHLAVLRQTILPV